MFKKGSKLELKSCPLPFKQKLGKKCHSVWSHIHVHTLAVKTNFIQK